MTDDLESIRRECLALVEELNAPPRYRWWLFLPGVALLVGGFVGAFFDVAQDIDIWPWPSVAIFSSMGLLLPWMRLSSRDNIRRLQAQRELFELQWQAYQLAKGLTP